MVKIAVFLDDQKEISTLEEKARIVVYEKNGDGWLVVKEIDNAIDFNQNLSAIRSGLEQLAKQLEDCKIIAGRLVGGIVYHCFDRLGFDIFELKAMDEEVLNSIVEDIKQEEQAKVVKSEDITNTSPVETSTPGIYFLDLVEIQKSHPEISSKKALQSFLNNKPFMQVDVICNHMPPWLDQMVENKKIEVKTELLKEGKVKVSIFKACCVS